MTQSEKPERLKDVELLPDAMERTERAIKAAFRTGHISMDQVKRTIAVKRRRQTARKPR